DPSTPDTYPPSLHAALPIWLRMPLPASASDLANPIRTLTEAGTTAGPEVTRVSPPEREYDGRRCHVHFAAAVGAKTYDIWVSTRSEEHTSELQSPYDIVCRL